MDTKKLELLEKLGFHKHVKNAKEGKCTTCAKPIDLTDMNAFKDNLSRKEYKISGMCQACQDHIFDQLKDNPALKKKGEETNQVKEMLKNPEIIDKLWEEIKNNKRTEMNCKDCPSKDTCSEEEKTAHMAKIVNEKADMPKYARASELAQSIKVELTVTAEEAIFITSALHTVLDLGKNIDTRNKLSAKNLETLDKTEKLMKKIIEITMKSNPNQ